MNYHNYFKLATISSGIKQFPIHRFNNSTHVMVRTILCEFIIFSNAGICCYNNIYIVLKFYSFLSIGKCKKKVLILHMQKNSQLFTKIFVLFSKICVCVCFSARSDVFKPGKVTTKKH